MRIRSTLKTRQNQRYRRRNLILNLWTISVWLTEDHIMHKHSRNPTPDLLLATASRRTLPAPQLLHYTFAPPPPGALRRTQCNTGIIVTGGLNSDSDAASRPVNMITSMPRGHKTDILPAKRCRLYCNLSLHHLSLFQDNTPPGCSRCHPKPTQQPLPLL